MQACMDITLDYFPMDIEISRLFSIYPSIKRQVEWKAVVLAIPHYATRGQYTARLIYTRNDRFFFRSQTSWEKQVSGSGLCFYSSVTNRFIHGIKITQKVSKCGRKKSSCCFYLASRVDSNTYVGFSPSASLLKSKGLENKSIIYIFLLKCRHKI